MISYHNQNKAFISFEKYSQNMHLQEKNSDSQFHLFALSARKLTLQKIAREQIYTNVRRCMINMSYNLQPKSQKNVTAWVMQIILDYFRNELIFFLCFISQAVLYFPIHNQISFLKHFSSNSAMHTSSYQWFRINHITVSTVG